VLRRGPWQQRRFSVLSPASSQHEAAPTGGGAWPQIRVVTNGPAAALPFAPGPATAPTGRSSLVLRRGPWQQRRFSVLSPASSQHKAAPTGGAFHRRSGWLPTDPPLPCRFLWSQLLHPPVGAALCCEEARGSSEDLVCCHRPLRSTRLLLQGGVSPQVRVVTNGPAVASGPSHCAHR